jgi:predicted RNase H-like HicB family nuclease
MTKYTYVATQEKGVWGITCPSLPGVFGVGKTRQAAENDFTKALNTLAAYLDEVGEALPKPRPVFLGTLSRA